MAKVGIAALVDEATGYQAKRAPDALREMVATATPLGQAKLRIAALEAEVARLKREMAKARRGVGPKRLDVVGVPLTGGRGKASVEASAGPTRCSAFCTVLHQHTR